MEIVLNSKSETQTKSKGKNVWQEFTIEYTGKNGQQTRTMRSFEKDAFKAISAANVGATIEVTVVKEGDYWKWKDAKVVGNASANDKAQEGAARSSKAKVGDWETAEERAAKQVYIVRQSSVASAINLLGVGAKVEDVLDVAKQFEAYVFDKQAKRGRKAAVEGDPIE